LNQTAGNIGANWPDPSKGVVGRTELREFRQEIAEIHGLLGEPL